MPHVHRKTPLRTVVLCLLTSAALTVGAGVSSAATSEDSTITATSTDDGSSTESTTTETPTSPEPSPSPSPEPSPSPSPDPSPSPSPDPSPSPEPEPSDEPEPTSQPETTSQPEPTSQPETTSQPDPKPSQESEPSPAPVPSDQGAAVPDTPQLETQRYPARDGRPSGGVVVERDEELEALPDNVQVPDSPQRPPAANDTIRPEALGRLAVVPDVGGDDGADVRASQPAVESRLPLAVLTGLVALVGIAAVGGTFWTLHRRRAARAGPHQT